MDLDFKEKAKEAVRSVHFMPDTEDADAAAESFWPDAFKEVIRSELGQTVVAAISGGKRFRKLYAERFCESYPDFDQFAKRIADMVVIGAERGADDAFDEMNAVFLTDSSLPPPEARRQARYLWPGPFHDDVRRSVHQAIVEEYSQEQSYLNAYEDQLPGRYRGCEEFINEIAEFAVVGAENGADDMLSKIFMSFLLRATLPPARRHPKRLRGY